MDDLSLQAAELRRELNGKDDEIARCAMAAEQMQQDAVVLQHNHDQLQQDICELQAAHETLRQALEVRSRLKISMKRARNGH
jgi:hypothetical protein